MDTGAEIGHYAPLGYDLHIMRADDWPQAEDAPIDFVEWHEYAQSDVRLISDGTIGFRGQVPPEQPVYLLGDDGPSIYWLRGRLVVEGAGESNLDALCSIAAALRARVQGDDGEFY